MGDEVQNLALERLPKRGQTDAPIEEIMTKWEGEHPRASRAFRDYVQLGPQRSLPNLAKIYSDPANIKIQPEGLRWTPNFESVLRQLKDYSSNFKWQSRLRLIITKATAEQLAETQKDALVHARERIRLARYAQLAGRTILEKAQLDKLSVTEARKLVNQGANLVKIGGDAERMETGDRAATMRPDKPIAKMSDEELEAFADVVLRAGV
jgi:hypothetical protein